MPNYASGTMELSIALRTPSPKRQRGVRDDKQSKMHQSAAQTPTIQPLL
ncbi:MAG: hypothetical protein ACK4RG_06640 [Fimbriimonadales bacterium]